MAKIISIISTKGGVGKTTLCANISGYLHSKGFRVLMIDADPQPSLSSYYNVQTKSNTVNGIYDILTSKVSITESIYHTNYCDIVLSNDSKNQLQTYLSNEIDGLYKLSDSIQEIKDSYDFIIIDTQGAKGVLQDSSILPADMLISPILAESTTIKEFYRGTINMINRLKPLEKRGIKIPPLYAVLYKVDNTRDTQQFMELINTNPNGFEYETLKTQVPQAVSFREATNNSMPVTDYKTRSTKGADATEKLTEEILLVLAAISFEEEYNNEDA